jgi:hypothetical protein
VSSVGCNPPAVFAGEATTCTVTLTGPAPEFVPITTRSSNLQVASVPISDGPGIATGASSTTFVVGTSIVPAPIAVTISANAGNTDPVFTTLPVQLTNRGRKWLLRNVTFKDGGTASGYFSYDAAARKYLDINITATAGNNAQDPWGAKLRKRLYFYPQNQGLTGDPNNALSSDSQLSVPNHFVSPANLQVQQHSIMRLLFSQPQPTLFRVRLILW